MPIDPSIPLSVRPAKIFTPQENEARDLEVQAGRLDVGERARTLRNQALVRGILTKYGGDLEKARPELYQVDPELGLKVDSQLSTARAHQFEFQKAQSEFHVQQGELLGRLAGTVNDDLSLHTFRQQAMAMGIPEAEKIPTAWNDQTKRVIDGIRQAAIPVVEQEREKARVAAAQLAESKAAEDARKNAATEALNRQDKEADNRRQDATAAETGRHNRATEAAAAVTARRLAAGGGLDPAFDIKPNSREYRIAQDLAYGKLTMTDFQRMYGRAASNANLKVSLYDKARELNPNFNAAQFEMGMKLASNPKVQQQLASLDNVVQAVPDLLAASDKASRSGVTVLNRFMQPIKVGLGAKTFTNFRTAQIAFADELSGALGYGSATDMSREMGFNMTDANLGPDQFKSALNDVVVPFVNRKRQTLLDQMGIYGQAGMNPAGDKAAASGQSAAPKPTHRFNPATGKIEEIK